MFKKTMRCCLMFSPKSLLFLLFLPIACTLSAQTLTLDELRTPPSPAFVLLGVEPSSVERPANPKSLAISLLSAATGNDLIPKNYALEVAPYWMVSHPGLTFDQYYKANVWQSIVQSLSVSLATSKFTEDSGGTGSETGIGLGMRFLFLTGKANSELSTLRSKLRNIQNQILDTDDPEKEKQLTKQAQDIALKIQSADKKRVGWRVEFANAISASYPDDNFNRGSIGRIGLWVTGSYELETPFLSFISCSRYLRDVHDNNEKDLFDIGGRLLYQNKDLSLSAEFVKRFINSQSSGDIQTNRLAGILEYRIREDLYLSGSFGKDYADEGQDNTLIALLGVHFGFGKEPKLKL